MRTPRGIAQSLALTMLALAGLFSGSALPSWTRSNAVVRARISNPDESSRASSGRDRSRRALSTFPAAGVASVPTLRESGEPLTPTSAPRVNGRIAFSRYLSVSEVYVMDADGGTRRNLSNSEGHDGYPVWSPDGSRIAFQSWRDGNGEIYMMNADGSSQRRLTNDPAFDGDPTWSPDGTRIAFTRARVSQFSVADRDSVALYVMNADGTNLTRLTTPGFAFDGEPVWSPDGSRIAFTRWQESQEIYATNVDGGGLTRLTNSPGPDFSPAWSPDGSKIAFTSQRDGNFEVYVMNSDGGGQTRLTNNPHSDDSQPAWSSDGTKITFISGRDGNNEIYTMGAGGNSQTRITNSPASEFAPHWSPDGNTIAFATYQAFNPEIYVMDDDGGGLLNLTNHPAADYAPAWSPDGTRVAFTSERDGNAEIYVMNSDGSGQTRLTNHPTADIDPDWSPDGSKIVFTGSDGIYVINADGSNRTRLIGQGVFGSGEPAWSPDGSRIAFTHSGEVCVMNAGGGNIACLTRHTFFEAATEPAWSPDGARISYSLIPIVNDQWTSTDEIYLMNADGGSRVNLTGSPNVVDGQSAWSPDGTRIAFMSESDGNAEIYVMSPDGSGRARLTRNLDAGNFDPDWQALPAAANSTVQFGAANYEVNEGAGSVTVTVTRAGDTSAAAAVNYRTSDDLSATVGCANTTMQPGVASDRCDYATTVGLLTFAAGETSTTISVPLIDDGRAEPGEAFRITLASPCGATIGTPATATVTITDNDAAEAKNPIFGNRFFVRQHYLDFLSREPEAGEPWTGVLDRCPDVDGDPSCDRVLVSQSFFRSPEFQLKGLYAYLFYRVAFGRLPEYREIIPDMRSLAGATAQEVFLRRGQYASAIAQRPEFTSLYGNMSNQSYVASLLGRYGLLRVTTEDPADFEGGAQVTLTAEQLVAALDGNSLTRAQVLRAVVQSTEVDAAEYHAAFVAMQYYGYLRRTPEQSGYEAWLRVIRQDPNNIRQMVNGFLNSQEYKLRFGQS